MNEKLVFFVLLFHTIFTRQTLMFLLKRIFFFLFIASIGFLHAQTDSLQVVFGLKKINTICRDTIFLNPVSIYPSDFQLTFKHNNQLVTLLEKNTDLIEVNYTQAVVVLKPLFFERYARPDHLEIQFATYPEFLTQQYYQYAPELVFPNLDPKNAIRISEIPKISYKGVPFEGLETQGSLIRGITIGNNQDAVLNSVLDLKISGKLTSKVNLNARINDTNIPLQDGGYSQEMKDIDRVYIQLESAKWNLQAGDLMLRDSTHYFLQLTKKVQGVSLNIATNDFNVFTSGALVRGKFATHEFEGQEGNQGPYKLVGSNGEHYLFLIEGSERVFINGVLQEKGLNHDYTIDYYTGEIRFTTQKPIHAEYRIVVEYQYAERNYNRFVTHNNLQYKKDKYQIGFSYFKESDMKNDALQITLTDAQKELLANAPQGSALLYVANVTQTPYDPLKILYKKTYILGEEVFEYSQNANDTLYEVGFTYFGANTGNYKVFEYRPNGKIMQFVGDNLGDYRAVIPLYAPGSQEVFLVDTNYKMNDKSNISFEMAISNNNKNLFAANQSVYYPALKMDWNQKIVDKKWKLFSFTQWDYLHKGFSNPEGTHQIEFNRNWNYQGEIGNRSLLISKLGFEKDKIVFGFYQYENLQFSTNYLGNRHLINTNVNFNKWNLEQNAVFLHSKSSTQITNYSTNQAQIKYTKEKWGSSLEWFNENNQMDNQIFNTSKTTNFQYKKWTFTKGDTAKNYIKTGLKFIQNDTIYLGNFNSKSNAKNYFIQSQYSVKEKSKIALFVNYRNTDYHDKNDLKSLNAKINLSYLAFKKIMNWRMEYQLHSGQLAKQDFTYIATEPGHGYYAWIDYNGNDLQEIDEFEIAVFPDQAIYLRVLLPNLIYIPTQNAHWEQTLSFDFSQLKKENRQYLKRWYNQTTLIAQTMQKRNENAWNYNPFGQKGTSVLNKRMQIQNQLYFNKNNSKYNGYYLYSKNNQRLWQSFSTIEQMINFHQFYFQYLIEGRWQISNYVEYSENKNDNESFINRNFNLKENAVKPQIAYFFTKNHYIKLGSKFSKKSNQSIDAERLIQSKILLNYQYTSATETRFSVDINFIKNAYNANYNTAVAYQMMEGLQAGSNLTWNVIWNKKINQFLYLNLIYSGRGNQSSRVVHNGNVQMRAVF